MFNQAKKVYGKYVNQDAFDTAKMVGERLASIANIVQSRTKVVVDNSTNPYIDTSRVCHIPALWVLPSYWQTFHSVGKTDSVYAVINNVIGAVTHEAQHAKFTKSLDLERLANSLLSNASKKDIAQLCTIFNIIEDWYIDNNAYNSREINDLSVYVAELRRLTNNPDNFVELKTQFLLTQTRGSFIKLGIAGLNPDYAAEFLETIESVLPVEIMQDFFDYVDNPNVNDSVQRENICREIFLFLNEDEETEEEQKKPSRTESESFSVSEEQAEELAEFMEQNQDLIEALADAANDSFKEMTDKMKEMDKAIKKKNPEVPELLKGFTSTGTPYVKDYKYSQAFPNYKVDSRWSSLIRYIRQFIDFNVKADHSSYDGDIDVDAYPNALSGDQKVFTEPSISKVKGFPEIVLMLDVSGSTCSSHKGGKSLKQNIMEAAHGVMETLLQNRVPFFCFTHTTYRSDSPLFHKIGSYNMPLNADTGDKRQMNKLDFANACKFGESIDSSGNVDGYALEWATMFFTGKREKVIVVLSDGQPSGSRYANLGASEYLSKTVEALKQKGYRVYSISLVSGVVKENDRYYGKEFNIDASGDINLALQKFAKAILLGQ